MEDFCDKYKNLAMAGPQTHFFAPRKQKQNPFCLNTRVYSCNLILNKAHFRWRGRYNEDTDLSIRMLKAGWCTIQFYAFLMGKLPTQTIGGGNTADFYAKDGTLPKSKMLVAMHPDCVRLVWRFNRWHHYADYKKFKYNKLIKDENNNIINDKVNNYGMILKDKRE
jgi:hypothetical protein